MHKGNNANHVRYHRSKTVMFADGKPYKKIKYNRGRGEYLLYSIYDDELVIFSHNDFTNKVYYAYTTTGAAYILNRSPRTIKRLIRDGYAPSAYVKMKYMTEYEEFFPARYLISKEAMIELHEALIIRSRVGNILKETPIKRKLPLIKSYEIPTKQEVEAQLKTDTLLYAKNNKGEFVRIWEAEDW